MRILVHQNSFEISQQTTRSLEYAFVNQNSFSPTPNLSNAVPSNLASMPHVTQLSALYHPSLHSREEQGRTGLSALMWGEKWKIVTAILSC